MKDEFDKEVKYARRVPLIAALMSSTLPGFGQLYNGQANRAIWFFVVFSLVAIPLCAIVALFLPARLMVVVLALSLIVTLGLWIYGIIDAFRTAKKLSPYALKPWQTPSLYALVFILFNLIVLPMMVRYVNHNHVQAFRIPTQSMSPSVQQGDFIFANKNYNCPTCLWSVKHGDIAVFVYPNNRNLHYIKRVIGLPGDVVASRDGIVSVNGVELSTQINAGSGEEATRTESLNGRIWIVDKKTSFDDFSTTVSAGHVFLLGDNRTASRDSRSFGEVPLADVVGQARQVWLSIGEDGVRWRRLGTSLMPVKTESP